MRAHSIYVALGFVLFRGFAVTPLYELMNTLRQKNVSLSIEAGQLRYAAQKRTLLPEELNEIRRRKSEILPFLAMTAASQLPITRSTREHSMRPTWQQESWWNNVKLKRLGVQWTNQIRAIRIKGPLDVSALERTFDAIVLRHEILRTRYVTKNGRPMLVLDEHKAFKLSITDLQRSEDAAQETASIATKLSRVPFDLETDHQIRVHLFHLAPDDYVLLVVVNHIVSDARTLQILWLEISAIYGSLTSGEPLDLPELPLQYIDYAMWQRAWLTDELLDHSKAYWDSQLGDSNLVLPLDSEEDRSLPDRALYVEFQFPTALGASLRKLSMRLQRSRFLIVAAGVKVLVAIWSGQRDIAIATVGNLRNRPELMNMAGYFSCTNPWRTDLSGDPAFSEIITRSLDTYSESLSHQVPAFLMDPFRRLRVYVNYIVAPAGPVASPPRTGPWQALELSDFSLLSVDNYRSPDARHLIAMHLVEAGDRIEGVINFGSQVFKPTTIELFIQRLTQLLEFVADQPEASMTQISARIKMQ